MLPPSTGLPPTIEEIDAFLADQSPDAYEKLVDRMLEKQDFGERMATDWLDVARYSDTYGYQVDRNRFVWPWRDWVIESLNADKGYERMAMEMLAGDEIVPFDPGNLRATGFLVRNRSFVRAGWIVIEEGTKLLTSGRAIRLTHSSLENNRNRKSCRVHWPHGTSCYAESIWT